MGSYGAPWSPMGPWESHGSHGVLWIPWVPCSPMDSHGLPLVPLGPMQPHGPLGVPWVPHHTDHSLLVAPRRRQRQHPWGKPTFGRFAFEWGHDSENSQWKVAVLFMSLGAVFFCRRYLKLVSDPSRHLCICDVDTFILRDRHVIDKVRLL